MKVILCLLCFVICKLYGFKVTPDVIDITKLPKHEYHQSSAAVMLAENRNDPVIRFAWDLFKATKQPKPDENNLVTCPILLQFLLAMLETVAAGETENQLQQVIGPKSARQLKAYFNLMNDENSELALATGIFIEKSHTDNINASFVERMKGLGSTVYLADFRNDSDFSKFYINQWAANATFGQITNILSPSYDVRTTELLLASAVYFHSTWKYQFQLIGQKLFYVNGKDLTNVEFMETKQWFICSQMPGNESATFIEIPYKGNEYSMVIILPDESITLDNYIRKLNSQNFIQLIKEFPKLKTKLIQLQIPKIKINSRFSFVNALLKLGLVDLFTINSDLPYMSSTKLEISDILQEASLTINENGTIAAAAMASLLVPLSFGGSSSSVLTINRPFLSVIIDKNQNLPLFISKVNNIH